MRDRVRGPEDAKKIILRKLRESYGYRIKVNFSKIRMETDLHSGRRLWMAEGALGVRRWLFIKKSWRFVYFIDAESGKVVIMRGKRYKDGFKWLDILLRLCSRIRRRR